jgi:hypothetical protein
MAESSHLSSDRPAAEVSVFRVLWKALALLILFNLAFAAWRPVQSLERISAYNVLFPGRSRLPFGEDSSRAYNLSLERLEPMLASHEISAGGKPADEFRVILLGDSSVWGFGLRSDETLAAALNRADVHDLQGKELKAYNLGYPTLSSFKDLLILERSLDFEPDMIVWFVTLESLLVSEQLESPLVQNHPQQARTLIERHTLPSDLADPRFVQESFWDQTFLGRRRRLADWFRLQAYGVLWAGTGVDQFIPEQFDPLEFEDPQSLAYHGIAPDTLDREDLAIQVLTAGMAEAGQVPVLLINEPIQKLPEAEQAGYYNNRYPQWAFDAYRQILAQEAAQAGWSWVDFWELLPSDVFTDSAIHYSPQGVAAVVEALAAALGAQPGVGD